MSLEYQIIESYVLLVCTVAHQFFELGGDHTMAQLIEQSDKTNSAESSLYSYVMNSVAGKTY